MDEQLERQLSLTDRLARDRTTLANERTFLAYVRTGLMMLVSGISVIKLVPEWGQWSVGLGAVLSVAGAAVFLWGLRRFAQVQRGLSALGGER